MQFSMQVKVILEHLNGFIMASNLDKVNDKSNFENEVDEPNLDAFNCSIFSDNANEVKLHYKLKYPGTYSIPISNILDLLENKVLFSHLQCSVKSFIDHVRKINKPNKGTSLSKTEITCGTKSKPNLNIHPKSSASTSTKAADLIEMPVAPTDLSVYDSVHSIKIPWSSYESVNLKHSKHTLFQRKKYESIQTFVNTQQADQVKKGLVFERVEKTLPSFSKRKLISPSILKERRVKRRMLMSSGGQEVDNVITIDEN